jgi:hypothetical protein
VPRTAGCRAPRRLQFAYLAPSPLPGRACGFPPTVHEPSPTAPYGASKPPARPVRVRQTRSSSWPSSSRIRLHLKPGQQGTKQLVAKYGESLVCVRYRCDPGRQRRFKTVEIIVDDRAWAPPQPRFADDQIVGLRVAYEEIEIRERVKQAGGTWTGRAASGSWPMATPSGSASATASSPSQHLPLDARRRRESIYRQMPGRYLHEDACIYW